MHVPCGRSWRMAATTKTAIVQRVPWLHRHNNLQTGHRQQPFETTFSPPIAQALFKVMASQVRPGLTKPYTGYGTSTVRKSDQASTSIFHQGQRPSTSHSQAECMAAISSCEPKPKRNAWHREGVHVCRYFVREIIGENASHLDNPLNTETILLAVKVAFFGVLKGYLASKGA